MSQIMSRTNRERNFQGANVPGIEYSWVQKFQWTKVPGPFRSGERKFQGANGPWIERAKEQKFQGAIWPESYWPIRSRERIGLGAKRLWITCSGWSVQIPRHYRWCTANGITESSTDPPAVPPAVMRSVSDGPVGRCGGRSITAGTTG